MRKLFLLFILISSFMSGYEVTMAKDIKEYPLPFDEALTVKSNSDTNWYHFTVKEEGKLTIETQYLGTNYQLTIFEKKSNAIIDEKVYVENSKTLTYGLKPGEYTISISSYEPSFDFSLTADFEVGVQQDSYPNNKKELAYKLQPNEVVKGHSYHIHPISEDYKVEYDYYKVDVPANKEIVAEVFNGSMKLLDATGELLEMNLTYKVFETITIDLPVQKGTYYFAVQGNKYQFSYKLVDQKGDTEIEGNNSFETATKISLGKAYKADVNDKDDYFQFTLTKNSFVDFEVGDLHPKKSFAFKLYDANKELITAERIKPAQSMYLRAGTYTFKLTNDRIIEDAYTIKVTASDAATNVSLEPNNTFEQAQPLALNSIVTSKGTSRASKKNVYKITVTKPGILNMFTQNISSEFALYTKSEQLIDTFNKGNVRTIGLKPGTYYIVDAGVSTERQLKVQFTAGAAEQEPNNQVSIASELPINEMLTGFLYKFDSTDLYVLKVPQTGSYTIKLKNQVSYFFSPKLVLTNSAGDTIFGNNFNEITKTLTLNKGTYYINLTHSTSTIYTLKWSPAKLADFKDVPSNYRYYKEITEMRNSDVITGYTDNTFKPTAAMKRQHVAAMMIRMGVASRMNTYRFEFPDVPLDHPNYHSIHLLSDAGIIDENPNGFNPENTITRAEMAKILVKAFEMKKKTGATPQFKDVNAKAWYKEYVDILASHGITIGYNGYYNPNATLTREQFSLFLYRTLEAFK